MLRIVFHDEREAWYRRYRRIIQKGSDRAPTTHHSTFILTTKDGQQVELLPSREAEPAKAAAAAPITGEGAMILGLPSTTLVRA